MPPAAHPWPFPQQCAECTTTPPPSLQPTVNLPQAIRMSPPAATDFCMPGRSIMYLSDYPLGTADQSVEQSAGMHDAILDQRFDAPVEPLV
jgi:hypothetical protein